MALTEFGKVVRKARLDAGETLQTMGRSLGISTSFMCDLELGRKNISEKWVNNIQQYFANRGIDVKNLGEYADISNQSVSLAGCDPQKKVLIAGFARASMNAETLSEFARLLQSIKDTK